jgi:hypothetical protein
MFGEIAMTDNSLLLLYSTSSHVNVLEITDRKRCGKQNNKALFELTAIGIKTS